MAQFSDLPSCLVMDILSRLPLTTLLTCRCVCRDWIRLFREPYFIKHQLTASPMHILLTLTQDISEECCRTICQLGELVEDKVTLRTLNLPRPIELDGGCMSSCNGLLCFLEGGYKRGVCVCVCVCNPISGEWVSIPAPDRKYYGSSTMTLVFSAKNNQYKVLHGFRTVKEVNRFEIYTLGGGTRQWRSIGETLALGSGDFCYGHEFHSFLHGSLHCIDPDALCVHSFDIDDEKFGRRISLPSCEGKSTYMMSSRMHLGVVNGSLCVLFFCESCDVEVWGMEEYGVEKSWVRMVRLFFHADMSRQFSPPFRLFSPNEGEVLILDSSGWLLSYDLMKRSRLGWCQLKNGDVISEAAYHPSFISLQDVAKGEEVMLPL